MGRAQKRELARARRLESKNEKIVLSKDEFQKWKQAIQTETSNFDVDMLMTCFALAQRRLYGFGKTRIQRSWDCIEDLMDDILNDNATLDDYKKELRDIL